MRTNDVTFYSVRQLALLSLSCMLLTLGFSTQVVRGQDPIHLSISKVDSAEVGTTIQIPLLLKDSVDADSILAFEFVARYDASVLKLTGVNKEGTLAEKGSLSKSNPAAGQLQAAFATANPIMGAPDTLLLLKAKIVGAGTSPLSFKSFTFSERKDLKVTTSDGSVHAFKSVDVGSSTQPSGSFKLFGNTPNPCTTDTKLRLRLPAPSRVQINMYDVRGRKVLEPSVRPLSAGASEIHLDTSALSAGVYVYNLTANGHTKTGTLVVAH